MESLSFSRSVMDATTAALARGTVCSTSRFHFPVRCGGQMMSTLWKPAMYAAAAPMKVFPVPISPTTVVPRWVCRERASAVSGNTRSRGIHPCWYSGAKCGSESVGSQISGAVPAILRRCLGQGVQAVTVEHRPCYRSVDRADKILSTRTQ